jgi:protein-tyrosine phosphatase
MDDARTVLFLCTGNYYRSRFAEMYFNHLAAARHLAWRAESRGLATELNHLLPGVISPLTCAALDRLGIELPPEHRPARRCSDADLESADLVVALNRPEHQPLLAARHPRFSGAVCFWDIRDRHDDPDNAALNELRIRIDRLIEQLAQEAQDS